MGLPALFSYFDAVYRNWSNSRYLVIFARVLSGAIATWENSLVRIFV
ncbi:MAG: hypothetical protein SAK42_02080 [Oscillatoria sp. PMC 1076.18]|nr:hypothetical protein [Oscillatoria sp. PMC 1076.18]